MGKKIDRPIRDFDRYNVYAQKKEKDSFTKDVYASFLYETFIERFKLCVILLSFWEELIKTEDMFTYTFKFPNNTRKVSYEEPKDSAKGLNLNDLDHFQPRRKTS